ncbi:hypothetical protein OIU76_022952 [Salix suchowensis]|nr:hypothetical protein OIU76_022952 [Salix suchowensis]
METDAGLKKLEYLSLVSKVCSELETHLGFGDKILAEFITELGRSCETVDEFDAKLKENGAEMPDYFVRTLLKIIHAILPPKAEKEGKKDKENDGSGKDSKFKALSIRDSRDRVKEIDRELEIEAEEKSRRENEDRYRERDNDDRHRESDRRERDRERERERDRYDRDNRRRDRGRRDGHDVEDGEGERERERDRYDRDNRRRDRGRRDEHDVEYGEGERERRNGKHGYGGSNSSEPELYGVYKGRVSRVMDTGCFVQLSDFRGKEGLVHVSQIATRRVGNAKDVVKRDQEVYVKVISVSGNKMSLSMRDVDQNSGKDLLPLKKRVGEEDGFRSNALGSSKGGAGDEDGVVRD